MPVWNLADPQTVLPGEIVVDSSVLIAAFVYPALGRPLTAAEQRQASLVHGFVRRVRGSGPAAFVPQTALSETIHKLLASFLKQDFDQLRSLPPAQRPANFPRDSRDLHKREPWRIAAHMPRIEQVVALIKTIGFVIVPSHALPWTGQDAWEDRLLRTMQSNPQMVNDATICSMRCE